MGKAREVTRHAVVSRGPETGAWAGFSDWQRVEGLPAMPVHVLAETLDGGQAFRWHRMGPAPDVDRVSGSAIQPPGIAEQREPRLAEWWGVWGNHVVRLRLGAAQGVEWSAPCSLQGSTTAALRRYLATDNDFSALADTLPWRSDSHLARCLTAFPRLRLLKQPFGETLLGFLCSATKQIVQIKQMVALLAQRHGAIIGRIERPPTAAGNTPVSRDAGIERGSVDPGVSAAPTVFHRLPTWGELAEIPEPVLRQCLLGFRARYIAETAKFLAQNHGWLDETELLPYPAAKERLCSLPGVGEKVADCVLLFGAGKLEAFPVDVWILKTMARRYALEGWRPAQIAQFGRVHFGPLAGLAQQYLFAWERRHGKSVPL